MNPSARYEDHARRLQARATEEYSIWVSRMTPAERAQLAALGVESPPDDDTEVGGHSPYAASDLAESPLARVETDMAGNIDTAEDELAERFSIPLELSHKILCWHDSAVKDSIRRHEAHFLGIIVGGLLSARNPKLAATGLAFAAGLDALNGLGCQREYARNNGLSVSAVSKVVKAWQRGLNLRPSAHQKSESACQTYSDVGKTRHWRNRRITTGTASRLLSKLKTNPANN